MVLLAIDAIVNLADAEREIVSQKKVAGRGGGRFAYRPGVDENASIWCFPERLVTGFCDAGQALEGFGDRRRSLRSSPLGRASAEQSGSGHRQGDTPNRS